MRSLDHTNEYHQQTNSPCTTLLTQKPAGKRQPTHEPKFPQTGDTIGGKYIGDTTPISTLNTFKFSNISTFPNQSIAIQPKLTINTPGDKYEQEADRMAEKVMRKEENIAAASGQPSTSLQRKCAACEEEEEGQELMRKAESGAGVTAGPSLIYHLNASKGS